MIPFSLWQPHFSPGSIKIAFSSAWLKSSGRVSIKKWSAFFRMMA